MRSPLPVPESSPVVRFVEVDAEGAGQRLDNFLLRHLKGVPKSHIYRLIRKGEVRVNKGRTKPEYKLQAGDTVRIPPVVTSEAPAPVFVGDQLANRLEAAILYEDDRLLVVNKPPGLAVHGGSGLALGLIEALREIRPGMPLELVHRLDRETSGVILIAKKRSMLRYLHECLRGTGVDKRYLALVVGQWPAHRREVEAPLRKNELQSGERMVKVAADGKPALTEFRVVRRFDGATLVEARPITGRTHQIRVHAQLAGHPLVADDKYTSEADNQIFRARGFRRLCLHAASLTVCLPGEREPRRFEAPLPDDIAVPLSSLPSRG